MSRNHATFAIAGLVMLLAACLPLSAGASTINIILSDLDVTYSQNEDGGAIADSRSFNGGNLQADQSDLLTSATFELGGGPPPASGGNNVIMMGDPSGNLYGDLLIDNLGGPLALNTLLTGLGGGGETFGFDLFSAAGSTPLLRLELDTIDLLLSAGVFFFTGEATVVDQDLPFDLAFDTSQPVLFSYTATLPAVALGGNASMAAGSGALTISGEMIIPEPNTVALLALGTLAVGLTFRRRRA